MGLEVDVDLYFEFHGQEFSLASGWFLLYTSFFVGRLVCSHISSFIFFVDFGLTAPAQIQPLLNRMQQGLAVHSALFCCEAEFESPLLRSESMGRRSV